MAMVERTARTMVAQEIQETTVWREFPTAPNPSLCVGAGLMMILTRKYVEIAQRIPGTM